MSPDTAIILETHNVQALPWRRQAEVLDQQIQRLRAEVDRAGRPVELLVMLTREAPDPELGDGVRLVRLPAETDYYGAKNFALQATAARFLVFADADCIPLPGWLAEIAAPLWDGLAQVAAGRTTYGHGTWGDATTAIDFPYFENRRAPGTVRNFYANNVAFCREVLAAQPFPSARTHRGQCGNLATALRRRGIPIHFAPAAHVIHPMPGSVGGWLRKRLQRGADLRALAPEVLGTHLPGARPLWQRTPGAALLLGRTVVGIGRCLRGPGSVTARGVAAGLATAISCVDLGGGIGSWAAQGVRRRDRLYRALASA